MDWVKSVRFVLIFFVAGPCGVGSGGDPQYLVFTIVDPENGIFESYVRRISDISLLGTLSQGNSEVKYNLISDLVAGPVAERRTRP